MGHLQGCRLNLLQLLDLPCMHFLASESGAGEWKMEYFCKWGGEIHSPLSFPCKPCRFPFVSTSLGDCPVAWGNLFCIHLAMPTWHHPHSRMQLATPTQPPAPSRLQLVLSADLATPTHAHLAALRWLHPPSHAHLTTVSCHRPPASRCYSPDH